MHVFFDWVAIKQLWGSDYMSATPLVNILDQYNVKSLCTHLFAA